MDEFLNDNLSIRPKVRLDDDWGIVTSCGQSYFPGFQLLYTSLVKTHRNVNILLWEVEGDELTEQQRCWVHEKTNAKIKRFAKDRFIASEDLIKPYHKPNMMLLTHFKRTVWLDCDQIVLRSISDLFNHIGNMPFIAANPIHGPNDSVLFKYIETATKFDDFNLSTSVVGFDRTVDEQKGLIEEWANITREVCWHPSNLTRFLCANDEGLMRLTLQRLNRVDCQWVWPDQHWSWLILPRDRVSNVYDNLHNIREKFPQTRIVHYCCRPKIWEVYGNFLNINPHEDV